MNSKHYKYILDFKANTDKFSKDVGGVKGMLKGAALAAGAMFAADKIMDAAVAVADYAKEISGVRSEIEKLSGLQGAALDQATGAAKALAVAYDADITQAVQASNAMMKTFGGTSNDAFDAMNKGFASTANSNGDFLKQVKEYSTHFDEAGLSASEMVAIIAEGNKMGVFDDKTADSIKEGSIRLREMTKSTRDALDGIGLSSTQIQKDIASGSKSMFEVMQEVSKKLSETQAQSPAVGAALADIFGGPGEDGIQFIRTLYSMNTNLDDLIDKASEQTQAQKAWGEELKEFHTLGAQVFGGTGEQITKVKTLFMSWVNDGMKGLVGITNYFIDLYNESAVFGGAIEYIGFSFKQVWEAAKLSLGLIWSNLKSVGKLVRAIFTFDKAAIKDALTNGFGGIGEAFGKYGESTADNFMEAWNSTFTTKKKIELISLSDDAAKDAGKKTGTNLAKGVAEGIRKASDYKTIDFTAYLGSDTEDEYDPFAGADGKATMYSATLGELNEKIRQSAEWNKLFGSSFQTTQEEIQLTEDAIASLIENGFDAADPKIQQLKEKLEGLNSVQHQLTKGALEYANSMKEMAKEGANSFAELGASVLNSIRAMIKGMIAEGVVAAMMHALKDVPFPFNLAAAATAGAAATTLFNMAIPQFADGGVISGPTIGLTGEYPNAINNPEWIGKRSDMLGDMKAAVQQTGGGGGSFSFRFEDGALMAYLDHLGRKVGGFA